MIFDWSDNDNKGMWFGVVPMMILGAITMGLFAAGVIPLVYLWASFVMWVMISGLGVAVGYHRVFSHRTHKLPTWKENIILWLGAMSAQGSALFWVAVHRGYHHPYADTKRDIHSPVAYSKWHAFMGWLNPDTCKKVNLRYSMAACFLPGLLGLLQDTLINVVGHTKLLIGYRNFETKDNSHNNLIFGYLAWGQGWHNNHHHNPKAFDFGGKRWWELDPCRIFKPFL